MATFIAIIDVLSVVISLIGLMAVIAGTAYVGGQKNWSVAEVVGTIVFAILWQGGVMSRRWAISMWVFGLIFCAFVGMTYSFYATVVLFPILLIGDYYFSKNAKTLFG